MRTVRYPGETAREADLRNRLHAANYGGCNDNDAVCEAIRAELAEIKASKVRK